MNESTASLGPRDVADLPPEERERLYLSAMADGDVDAAEALVHGSLPADWPEDVRRPWEARRDLVTMLREEGLPDPARISPARLAHIRSAFAEHFAHLRSTSREKAQGDRAAEPRLRDRDARPQRVSGTLRLTRNRSSCKRERMFKASLDMEKGWIVNSFLVCLSVLGAISVLSREWTFGVALHWDSINYIAVARNLLEGEGLIQATWFPPQLTSWPPLYPFVLAAAAFPSLDPHDVAGPVNAAVFGLTIFISGKWLWSRLKSRLLRLWACIAIALSIPLAWMAAAAMSESLFILLMMVSLILVDSFCRRDQVALLVWAAVFAGLACMTKYQGVMIIATSVAVLVIRQGSPPGRRICHIVTYATIAALPLLLWGGRNIMLGTKFFGPRPSLPLEFLSNLSGLMAVFSEWMVPSLPMRNHLPYDVSLLAVAVFGILLLVLTVSLAWITMASFVRTEIWRRWLPFIVFGTYALLSLVAFAPSMSGTGHGVQTRFLVPLYIPLLFTLAFAADRGLCRVKAKRVGRKTARSLNLAVPALFVLCTGYLASLNALAIIRTNSLGTPFTFSIPRWQGSETLEFVSGVQKDRKIFSQTAPAIYIFTDGSASGYINIHTEDEFHKSLDESVEGDLFVHFSGIHTLYDISDLHLSPKLRLVVELTDGIIFERIEAGKIMTE